MRALLVGWLVAVVVQFVVLITTGNVADVGAISLASFIPGMDPARAATDGRIQGAEWLWLLSQWLAPITIAATYVALNKRP